MASGGGRANSTVCGGACPEPGGGEKLRSAIFRNFPQFRNFSQFSAIFRNFPQFSAIFPQFFTLPDFLTASPRWCRTMRFFFFTIPYTLKCCKVTRTWYSSIGSTTALQFQGPGFKPSWAQYGYLRFFGLFTFAFLVFFMPACLHVCMCMSDVPEIAEQCSLYIRCNVVDINGPTALQEWWQSRAPSPFQERVLFLITQPTSGGDVERFFSQCRTVSKRQHKLDDNIRRLRFMLQFHGDIEGRLL